MQLLLDGIPETQDYLSLLATSEFIEMRNFSRQFLLDNKEDLGRYSRQWVKDPLSQWSRQWEYPFVFNKIKTLCTKNDAIRILDAGSGVTFFPYYIKSHFPLTEISCVDNDQNLERVYKQINIHNKQKIDFFGSDIKELPYESDWFNAVYCISVLEHVTDHAKIVEEFHRIIKPGGSLVVTFDLSLDGTRDITIEKGKVLLELFAQKFESAIDAKYDLNYQVDSPDVFTTLSANKISPSLLPWRFPSFLYQIKSFMSGRGFIHWPPSLTIFCASFTKHPQF